MVIRLVFFLSVIGAMGLTLWGQFLPKYYQVRFLLPNCEASGRAAHLECRKHSPLNLLAKGCTLWSGWPDPETSAQLFKTSCAFQCEDFPECVIDQGQDLRVQCAANGT